MIHRVTVLSESDDHQKLPNGRWFPARHVSMGGIHEIKDRIKGAWMVLWGRADALVWPQQERSDG